MPDLKTVNKIFTGITKCKGEAHESSNNSKPQAGLSFQLCPVSTFKPARVAFAS